MSIQERLGCSSLLEVHKKLMQCQETGQNKLSKLDELLLAKNHKFLWSSVEGLTWEEELAKKYYDKLFKEYCICDLSKYKENKVALRWRTKSEVISGKGQFLCAEKKCDVKEHLKTWEVNFCYLEDGQKKNALVKIKLCSDCSGKLNYQSKKREVKRLKKSRGKHKYEGMREDKNEPSSSGNEQVKVSFQDTPVSPTDNGENIHSPWSQKVEIDLKSRDEEMDEYLDDLLF